MQWLHSVHQQIAFRSHLAMHFARLLNIIELPYFGIHHTRTLCNCAYLVTIFPQRHQLTTLVNNYSNFLQNVVCQLKIEKIKHFFFFKWNELKCIWNSIIINLLIIWYWFESISFTSCLDNLPTCEIVPFPVTATGNTHGTRMWRSGNTKKK